MRDLFNLSTLQPFNPSTFQPFNLSTMKATPSCTAPDLITQYTDIVTKTMETIAREERENIRKA